MKTTSYISCVCISACLFSESLAFADSLVFSNGSTITGTILQTNDDQILLLAGDAAFNFSKSKLKEIKVESLEVLHSSKSERLANFSDAILLLSKQVWATNLTPIPATVIDKGVLRNVPYCSFRCGEDYELNIYGDLENPVGIEIGIYRKLLDDPNAKTNCLEFFNDLLSNSGDKEMVRKLNLKTDYQIREDLTFEITPPTDLDSYHGWWVSVYYEQKLSSARASDAEMKRITLNKAKAVSTSVNSNDIMAWSAKDLQLARASTPTTISFVNSSGLLVTNAEVVRVIDGVSLIYRTGPTSGGMVRLADLPENLRNEFGYDAVKTEAADALAKQQKAKWQQQENASQVAQQSQAYSAAQYASPYPQYYNFADYSGDYYSGGGSVYVHGYTRKNGTYVHSYTRRR